MEHGESYVIVKYVRGVQEKRRFFWGGGEWIQNRGEASIYSARQLEAAEDIAVEVGGEVVNTENL